MSDLSVPSLIGLDAHERLLKEVVVGAVGDRGHGHELEVREPGFEHEVELHGDFYGVGSEDHVVEEVPCRDHHPFSGVIGPVGPVEVAVEAQEVVAEQQWDLRMPDLVERAERCHRAPCAVAAEARHPQLCHRGRVLR